MTSNEIDRDQFIFIDKNKFISLQDLEKPLNLQNFQISQLYKPLELEPLTTIQDFSGIIDIPKIDIDSIKTKIAEIFNNEIPEMTRSDFIIDCPPLPQGTHLFPTSQACVSIIGKDTIDKVSGYDIMCES